MKISRLGEAPDYRFSLANERTYLAWIRTALGFLAAGVGLDQLAPDFATPLIREVLALLLCLFAGVLAIYGYLRWLRNEKAMRLKQDLPYTRGLLIISAILLTVAGGMMDNPEVLRGTLALYDWTDDEMNRRRLEAIVAVKHTLIRRFEKGFMLRGVDIEVTLNMDNFAGEGDVNLFGEMLHRFFALYADIHLFNQLTLVLQPTGKRLRWRENHSQHVPG